MKSFIYLMLLIASCIGVCASSSASDYFHPDDGSYPSQIQAQNAYDKVRRDKTAQFIHWLGLRSEPTDIRLFACKYGYYSHFAFKTYQSKSYITCKVAFLDGLQTRLFTETINFRRLKQHHWEFMVP